MAIASFLAMGPSMPWEISPLMSYLSFLLLFFTTLVVVDSLSRLRWVLLMAVGSVAFASLYVLREWQKYHNVFLLGWVTGDVNYFTASALLCLPIAFFLIRKQQPQWERWFCLGCLVITLLAVTLAASRGGFFGLVAASLLAVWRLHHRVLSLILVGALLILLNLLLPVSPLERLLNPDHLDQGSAEARKVLWKAGLRMAWENPLMGIGLGNFKPLLGFYSDQGERLQHIAHNSYIEFAAEMGLPGLLAFLAILFYSFRSLEQVRRQTLESGPPLLHQAAQGIQTGLVGYAVSIFFVSGQYQKLFWLMVFLSVCLHALVRTEVGAQSPRWLQG